MSLVGKLFKLTAATIANQPWVDLVFPASCISCNQELAGKRIATTRPSFDDSRSALEPQGNSAAEFQAWQASNWCHNCWVQLNPKTRFLCLKCGAHLRGPSPMVGHCANCLKAGLKFDRAISVGNYEGLVRDLVIRMKNQHDDVLAIHLGRRIAYDLIGQGLTEFDRLIPVPLHWSRRLKRGFQATEILSHQISRITGIRRCTRTVRIVRATAKQGTLSTKARQANVRNAFSIRTGWPVDGARILLVDDVMTSGATASEIARVLKAAGAGYVGVAVIARGGVI